MIAELFEGGKYGTVALIVGVIVAAFSMVMKWFRGSKKTTTVPLGDQYPGADKVAEAYEEHLEKKRGSRDDRLAGALRRAIRRRAKKRDG